MTGILVAHCAAPCDLDDSRVSTSVSPAIEQTLVSQNGQHQVELSYVLPFRIHIHLIKIIPE